MDIFGAEFEEMNQIESAELPPEHETIKGSGTLVGFFNDCRRAMAHHAGRAFADRPWL